MMSKKVIFFGNERLATGVATTAPTLQALIKNGYDVQAVVVNEAADSLNKNRRLEIAEVALKNNITLHTPKKLRDIKSLLEECQADIGVLVAFGQMIPQEIIDLFPHGIINIHPSNLPLHRGPIPLESVILAGETSTAISIMQLVKAMDAGPVLAQERVTLIGNETKQDLADRLLEKGSCMIIDLLPKIFAGSIIPQPQGGQAATYDSLIKKEDGVISWQESASVIERKIRAYAGWPRATATLYEQSVILLQATPIENTHQLQVGECFRDKNNLEIGCGDGSTLAIHALQPIGKKPMAIKDFLNGLRSA